MKLALVWSEAALLVGGTGLRQAVRGFVQGKHLVVAGDSLWLKVLWCPHPVSWLLVCLDGGDIWVRQVVPLPTGPSVQQSPRGCCRRPRKHRGHGGMLDLWGELEISPPTSPNRAVAVQHLGTLPVPGSPLCACSRGHVGTPLPSPHGTGL